MTKKSFQNVMEKTKKSLRKKELKTLGLSPLFSQTKKGPPESALPGGIIVHFKTKKDKTALMNWAKKYHLQGLLKLPHKKEESYFVSTQAGFNTFTLLKKMAIDPEVKMAAPNLWRPLSTK